MPKKKKKARYSIMALASLAIILVVTGLVIAFGSKVNSDLGSTFTANSVAANASTAVGTGLGTFSSYLPTIALVVVAVVIIGLLIAGFGRFTGGGKGL